MILFMTVGVPTVIALLTGLRGYRDKPETPGAYAIGALWTLLFGAAFVFAWHVAWLGAASLSLGAAQGLVGGAIFNTALSAAVWLPALMISYTFSAQRARNDR